ncbi:MAG TPA: response regulator transcription factor [Streptosporangiaceae bacterium]|jgi:DNA-binding response OmpR family regulator
MHPAEILVAEHEPAVAELTRRYLAREGLCVRSTRTPADTTAALAGCRAAVAVLDLAMPGLDARQIRRLICVTPGPRGRAGGQPAVRGAADAVLVPLICLTAGEAAQGLRPEDIGVSRDACLPRPFGPRTLVARVRAAARAVSAQAPAARAAAPSTAGGLSLDPAARLACRDGVPVALTGTEFDLLACLVRGAGRAQSRGRLRQEVWGRDSAAGDRIVDVYIAQLRAKLGPDGGIRTVRGVGYVLDPPAQGAPPRPAGNRGGPTGGPAAPRYDRGRRASDPTGDPRG